MSFHVIGMKLRPELLTVEELSAMVTAIDISDALAYFVSRDPKADDGCADIAGLAYWIKDHQNAREYLRSLGYPMETSMFIRAMAKQSS